MQHCDIVIIGAGVAGASLGWRLAPHASVILLEREAAPGYHATGRSATHINLSVGRAEVQQLTRLGLSFFRSPPAGFTEVPLLSPSPTLTVATRAQLEALGRIERGLQAVGAHPERVTADGLRARVPILRTGPEALVAGLFDPESYRIDGNALLQGYLSGLRRHGGQVITGAAPEAVRRSDGRWEVHTPLGSFSAPLLVNAAGAWADEVAALCGVRPVGLQPLRRTVVTFNLPAGIDARGWPFVKCAEENFYFVPEAGGLLLSPADETPSPPTDAQPEELDVAIAMDRFERVTTVTVPRLLSRWAGLRSFVADRLPVIGADPAEPAFFWLVGQGGAGLQTSPALSAAAAALLEPSLEAGAFPVARLSPARLAA
jgi:D-arginine dehydrogenase